MIIVDKFLKEIQKNIDMNIYYKQYENKSGEPIDTIQIILQSLKNCNAKPYQLCDTNYFARWYTINLEPLFDHHQLCKGMIVYKAKIYTDEDFCLSKDFDSYSIYEKGRNAKDYYHAGIVVNCDPLEIVHLIKQDDKILVKKDTKLKDLREWCYCGFVHDVEYSKDELNMRL